MITRNYIYALSSSTGINNENNCTDGSFGVVRTIKNNLVIDKANGSGNFTIIRHSITRNISDRSEINNIELNDLRPSLGVQYKCISYVYLGSGKTEPTYDDYTLESVIPVSKLKVKSIDIIRSIDFDTLFTISSIVENISTENIDVSEIGWFYFPSSNINNAILMARETFDTITMKPGEVRSFVMTIK